MSTVLSTDKAPGEKSMPLTRGLTEKQVAAFVRRGAPYSPDGQPILAPPKKDKNG